MPGSLALRPFRSLIRLSWPGHALLVCGAFLLVGIAVVDDYGTGVDTRDQRIIASRNLAFIVGDAARLDGVKTKHNRYYGIAFELPLLLFERGVEWKDTRSIYLLRHLVTHGFFLVGGVCCALLVYRLTRSRTVALFALLLFVVQPRLYAHSFFNSKDLPFLSLFMVTLYVTHRAFRRDTVGAFVLCGVCVGVLTNLRIMGVLLFPAVLALRGLDLLQAGRAARTHVLVTGGVFALAGPGTLYALSPYLWVDPFEFGTALQTLAHHPSTPRELFQGREFRANDLPPHFIPTWMVISTPPVTLVCGVLGVIVAGVRSLRGPGGASGNTDLRFGLLLVACLTLPMLAIIVLGSHVYNNWRQVYFLHAPLCCLAGVGMHWAGRGAGPRLVVYALVGLGVLVTGREMVRLHPHQQVYFNALVDRTTPESLRTTWRLDPWLVSCREGLDFLRRRYPGTTVYIKSSAPVYISWVTLPQADRTRLVLVETGPRVAVRWLQPVDRAQFVPGEGSFDVQLLCGQDLQRQKELSSENVLYVRKVYNSTLVQVAGMVTVPDRERALAHRTDSYLGVTSGRLVRKAGFELYRYRHSRRLGYAKKGCPASDVQAPFFLHVVPVVAAELPAARRQFGFANLDFSFSPSGYREKGKCWTTVELPAYAIARIRTGQYNEQGRLWETELIWPDSGS